MADKHTVDARGLSCPQPVLMTKKARRQILLQTLLRSSSTTAPPRKTSPALRSNSGFTVTVTEQDGDFYLALKK